MLTPDGQTTNVSESASTQLTLAGNVGIGEPLVSATVSIIDLTDSESPEILGTTSTDAAGHFEFTVGELDENSILLFVASGGSYLDPLTYLSVSDKTAALQGAWRIKNIRKLSRLDITPLSTLATAFFTCLSINPLLAADPLDYSIASFNSTFGIDLNTTYDSYLEPVDTESEQTTIYSLYNLAFARMAKEKRATSAISLITNFANRLEDDCDLLGPSGITSGSYAFHSESFRKDYLTAFMNLTSEASLSAWADAVDLIETAQNIREVSSIIFEFRDYDL